MKNYISKKVKLFINKGKKEYELKRYYNALKYFKKAINIKPNLEISTINLAITYNQVGKFKEAISILKKILKTNSKHKTANFDIGYSYWKIKNYKKSISYFIRAIKINPKNVSAYVLLGLAYKDSGKLKIAIDTYINALKLFPNEKMILNNLGNLYKENGDLDTAINIFKKSNSYASLSTLYWEIGDNLAALKYCNKEISVDPKNYYLNCLSGNIYYAIQKYNYGILSFQNALKINPKGANALIGLYEGFRNICYWDGAEKIEKKDLFIKNVSAFYSILSNENPLENLQSAKNESLEYDINKYKISRIKIQKKTKKIRIGFISTDFRDHPTAHIMSAYFKNYNKNIFELFVYSLNYDDESRERQIIANNCDKFYDMSNWGVHQIYEKINADKLDILIDLNGHTSTKTNLVLAKRPSKIQIHFLGFPGTTGAKYIDYLIADKWVIPKEHYKYYTEKIISLSGSFIFTNDSINLNQTKYKKSDFNLPSDKIILGSFCGPIKIDRKTFNLWMSIMKKNKNTILWLRHTDDLTMENLKNSAKANGVKPQRLIFNKRISSKIEHLNRTSLTDIALDPLIYGGHSTTIDYLKSGVPVITKIGNHFANRVSASILINAGIPECVVKTEKDYLNLTSELINNNKKLRMLKIKIMKNQKTKPFFNTKTYARKLEAKLKKLVTSLNT